MTEIGLMKYDAMCSAIADCHSVDEVKELRDKARALQVYAQQAKNTEIEQKAIEIRIRAERRAGELIQEQQRDGQLAKPEDPGPGRGRKEKRFPRGTVFLKRRWLTMASARSNPPNGRNSPTSRTINSRRR